MNWIKKVISRKAPLKPSTRRRLDPDAIDLVGDDPAIALSKLPSRNSMVSNLAGLDPEVSADLTHDLEGTQRRSQEGPSIDRIDLDFDNDTNQSDQYEAVSFSNDEGISPGPLSTHAASKQPQADQPNAPAHLQRNPLDPEPPATFPFVADQGFDLKLSSEPEPPSYTETPPPSVQRSTTDSMISDFDLDLDDVAAEESSATAASLQSFTQSNADPLEQSLAAFADEESHLSATASGDFTFDPPETASTASLSQELENHTAENFDATVITAADTPDTGADTGYATGWVIVIAGPGKGQSRPIYSGSNSIGRSPDQAVPLYFGANSDGEISRRDHTRIIYDAQSNDFKLIHGASRNLTYLNDEVVREITDLKAYDRIIIGRTTLLFLPLCGTIFRW